MAGTFKLVSGMFKSESVCAVERLEHPQEEGFRLVEFSSWWVE